MANLDAPFGFKPVRYSDGRAYTGAVNEYRKEASVIIGIGDAVVITGDSSTVGTNNADRDGVPLVDRAAGASGTISGVVVGFRKDNDRERFTHAKRMAAADTGYLLVADDPHLIFEIQEDSDGGSLARTDVGRGVDIIVANANANTGLSNMEIDSSTAGQAQLRVIRLAQRPNNDVGTNAVWEVMINEHTYNATQTLI